MKQRKDTYKIYLVDDHPIVRKGISQVIDQEDDLEVCGTADNADDTLRDVERLGPDLVIVDISLEGISGIDIIKGLKSRYPSLATMVLSMHDESIYAERALRAGARGYIMKKEASEKIVGAIRQVLDGKIYLSGEMASRLIEKFASTDQIENGSPIDLLTNRELEIFRMIGCGYKPRDIARELNLSIKTVETYRDHIKKKLNLSTAAELTRYAVEWVNVMNI